MKDEIMQILSELSKAINVHYGYVKLEGSNYSEPVINSGPCGPFAKTPNFKVEQVYMGEYEIPGRRYLWQTREEIDFHLQIFGYDHIGARNCLLFRDYLIKHPEKAKEYSEIKELASLKFPKDMHAYWQEKRFIVEKFLNGAIKEHNKSGKEKG